MKAYIGQITGRPRLKRFLVFSFAIAVSGFGLAAWLYITAVAKPVAFDDDVFLIARGDSVSAIAEELESRGLISHPYALKFYVRLNRVGRLIKPGEYKFPRGTTLSEFVDSIVSAKGRVGMKVTILEGWTFRQMREAMDAAPKLVHITGDWSDGQIMAELGSPDLHPEGQFYPDTYQYYLGDTDLSIYRESFLLMRDKLDHAWKNRSRDIQIKRPYQALVLASIIEKESQVDDEQPLISGVFDNRLRLGMRLQADPTVIYGLGEDYSGKIRTKHLKTDTPYNTYTRHGLTPTPISLPGHTSLMAAVNPEKTENLYFVAKGEGRHKFSKTLEEHNAAVKKYILNR